jgi:hypothetical protein
VCDTEGGDQDGTPGSVRQAASYGKMALFCKKVVRQNDLALS